MVDDWSRPVSVGPEDHGWLADARPDLGPLRKATERGELDDAMACLAGSSGFRLRGDDPLAPLAREVARALTLAGFTVHHCVRADPLNRLGGVCLLPVAAWGSVGGQAGVAVSWTTHSLLSLDWDRWAEYRSVQEAMNPALAVVLDAAGFCVEPFGQGGASVVTGRRDADDLGAGR
jgi:hypothetical protein